ncbi:MAG: hypothetical protein LLF76_10725 [Planctomycetaceae bacterium]|nr:hypothetical protein [Planctomycetaceae bacterium]
MSKNKAAILLSYLALACTVQAANLVINGDFEDPAKTGWNLWWGVEGGKYVNGNRYIADPLDTNPADGTNYCAGVWWTDNGVNQSIPIGPGLYEFGGKIMTPNPGGLLNRNGIMQCEFGEVVPYFLIPGDAPNVWHIRSGIIDNTTAGATSVLINLLMANLATPNGGNIYFDEIYFGPVGVSNQAKFPHPRDGEVGVQLINPVLRWTNAEPNNPADTVTSDVFLGTSPAALAQIANDITAESVAVSLLPNTQYYWRVDCMDPHGDPNAPYGPRTTAGDVWTFTTTNDIAPVVNAGIDKYLWIDMADGDGDPAKVTFTLDGVVTDDGKSPVTRLWALTYSEQDPATAINIVNPASAVTSVNINGTGLYTFTLSADDAFSHAEDAVTVIVYGSACAAAQGDPSDIPARYPGGHGDINGDCLTNLTDLAIMAGSWIDCMSAKLGCTP